MIKVQIKDGLPITPEQSAAILQGESNKFGIFFDFYRIIEYIAYNNAIVFENAYMARELYKVELSKKQEVLAFLSNNLKNREVLHYKDKSGIRYSDVYVNEYVRDNIRKQEPSNIVIQDFLDILEKYISASKAVSNLQSYANLPKADILSRDGHIMTHGNPTIHILNTFRLSYKDPGVQTIARPFQDIICAPVGYSMVHCDSSQMEPRLTYSHFIKDPILKYYIQYYNDAYYGILAYVLLDDDVYNKREQIPLESLPTPEISEEFKSMRKTMKTLALAVGYGSEVNTMGVDQFIFDRYMKRISKNPYRERWEAKVSQDVQRGVTSFYTAFGTKITPQPTDKVTPSDGKRWQKHLVRAGMNNPIQGTAADLMHISVYNAYNIIQGKDAHIACYIHDAGVFYVKDGDEDTIQKLSDITAYDIWNGDEQWISIPSESEVNNYASSVGSRFDSNTLYRCSL